MAGGGSATAESGDPWIRQAAETDIPDLAALHVAAWRIAYAGILPRTLLDRLSPHEFEQIWQGILRDGRRTTLVACLTERGGPAAFVGTCIEPQPEIIGLYVDPRHWRRGLGSALVAAARARMAAAGAQRVLLWVMRDNARARAFYERCGFAATGERRESERYGVSFEELKYSGSAVAGR